MFKVWCLRFDGWEICPWTYEGYDDQESKEDDYGSEEIDDESVK